jgi:outer membrane receptor protein involved in Fe transport
VDRSRRVSGRYQIDLERGDLGLSTGWEGLAERADNTFITGETFEEIPVERSLNGFFAEARWRRARGLVHVGALETHRPGAIRRPQPVWPGPPSTGVVWSPVPGRRGGCRNPADWTRIRGGAGTGIKPPTAFEIAFTDNPSLKPERSVSADAGIEHAAAGGAFVVDATWFYNRYDQLIVAVGSSLQGASRYRTDNIANGRAQGLELGANWRGPRGLSARVAWTFLDAEVLAVDNLAGQAPAPYAVGDPLIRRPGSQGLLDVAWSNSRARVSMTINGRGDVTDFEPNFAQTLYTNPGYVTTMIGASITIAPGLEVYGRITNLFDRTYEEAYGFPALGRAGMIGLRIARSR